MKSVLLTGITGFVGSHMADYLLEHTDYTIHASRRWRSRDENIKHFYGNKRVIFYEVDLMDRGSLNRFVNDAKPDYVFHFAAQSFPETSFLMPVQTLQTNVVGTTNLLEELKYAKQRGVCDPIIISVSSSEVYGMPKPEEIPIKESNPIRAANPYSISKVGHDLMSQYYFKAYGLKIITTRMFSHEGARRGKIFALSSFAYQIALHEKDYKKHLDEHKDGCFADGAFVIKVGNLNSVRTYAHISDAVHAYWLAATKATVGEVYNIGGNYTCKVGDALDEIMSQSIIPKQCFSVFVDPDRVRPTDITLQVPDSTKFSVETGWKPTIGLKPICADLLNYWRSIV